MQFNPPMELGRLTRAGKNQAPSALGDTDRLIELSSWMLVLGTIRLVCTIADNASAFLESTQSNAPFFWLIEKFAQESHPFLALGTVWPLVLALALRKTRWPELLKAAAATFLILSICGVVEFSALWAHSPRTLLTLGSFHIPRRALSSPFFSEVVLGLLGTTQLVFEFGVAVWAIILGIQLRGSTPADSSKPLAARRARLGRLAVFVCLVFFVLVIRGSVWSAYLEVLNQSTIVREFVLRSDLNRVHTRRSRPRSTLEIEQDRQISEMQALLAAASQAWEDGRIASAKDSYLELVKRIDATSQDNWMPALRYTASHAFNNLAWLLATCSENKFRDPQGAITYAKRAVGIAPGDGNSWNTLGVAYYRAGELEEAKNALYRSMELRNEGDSFDWFFLASIHFRLGHKERAREWYDRAAARLKEIPQFGNSLTLTQLDELYRFEVEAAEVLSLPKPARPPATIRDPLRWSGAEVIGIPIPGIPPSPTRFSHLPNSANLNFPLRFDRRTVRGLLKAAPPTGQSR